jgi:hypothetical protein
MSFTPAAIITITGICLTFVLNVYQSIKSRHFHSECFNCTGQKCIDCNYQSEHQDRAEK